MQDAPILVVGTSTGAVKVLRLTGQLGQTDGNDPDVQAKFLQATVQANLSSARAGGK